MDGEYTIEQLGKIFENLPKKLQDKIIALETAEKIFDICCENGVEDERISDVALYVGRVLMGLLPPSKFEETLIEKAKVEKEKAEKIAKEISGAIFSSVEEELKSLYGEGVVPPSPPSKIPTQTPSIEEKPPPPPKRDIYREPIE
jgi:hypothetical protein